MENSNFRVYLESISKTILDISQSNYASGSFFIMVLRYYQSKDENILNLSSVAFTKILKFHCSRNIVRLKQILKIPSKDIAFHKIHCFSEEQLLKNLKPLNQLF